MLGHCCRGAGAVFLVAIGSLLAQLDGAEAAPGAVKLDNYTLDKALAIADHSFLVKFDKSYPYGEKEDEFKILCKQAYSVPKFFIGEVQVQEYGDKENDDLREKYKLNKDDFPIYLFFDTANTEGLKYTGAHKAEDIAAWLRRNQVKMPAVGTIAELDEIARAFLKEGLPEAQIGKAKELAQGQYSTDKKATMYVKIMEKVKEKGVAYLTSESERVSKLMDSKVTAEKKAELVDKMKILSVFSTKEEL